MSQNENRIKNENGEKKGFSLPPTKAKPPMPKVNPPKKQQ